MCCPFSEYPKRNSASTDQDSAKRLCALNDSSLPYTQSEAVHATLQKVEHFDQW